MLLQIHAEYVREPLVSCQSSGKDVSRVPWSIGKPGWLRLRLLHLMTKISQLLRGRKELPELILAVRRAVENLKAIGGFRVLCVGNRKVSRYVHAGGCGW